VTADAACVSTGVIPVCLYSRAVEKLEKSMSAAYSHKAHKADDSTD